MSMIIGIGCDIVDHDLTLKLKWDSNGTLQRIFSKREFLIYDIKKEIKFVAGRFAVKEAVLKCIGTGMIDGIALSEIEILQLKNGKPKLKLTGKVKKLSDQLGIDTWFVSISHTTTTSIAMVIAESRKI